MIIFSRYRAPWVGFVFILILVIASLMRLQTNMDEEKELLAKDQAGFLTFKEDMAKLDVNAQILNSKMLFEIYRCGVRSINDKSYCEKLAEQLYNDLNEKQREGMKKLVEKYFE